MTGDDGLHYPKWSDEDVATGRRLAADWQSASERAFGVALAQPDVYQLNASLVGALVRRLREEGPGPTVLVAAWNRRWSLLEELGATGGDLETVAGAAFALRYREVQLEIQAAHRLHLLSEQPPRDGWVVLEESGFSPGDPMSPYRRIEAEPRSGRALLVTTRPDETFTVCVHEIVVGRLDPATGALDWDESRPTDSHADATSREAAVSALKRRVEE